MKVYWCDDHEGHYPVGVASVVVATNEDDARLLLITELHKRGLYTKEPFTLKELNTETAEAIVINDGDY